MFVNVGGHLVRKLWKTKTSHKKDKDVNAFYKSESKITVI